MPERKEAIINVRKGLLDLSLSSLSVFGTATGQPVVAVLTALPQAIVSASLIKQLLKLRQGEPLLVPIPTKWWTEDLHRWQAVCTHIESRLPTIIKGVEEHVRQEKTYPSPSVIKAIFTRQVAQQLSPWEVKLQDREMVAGYLTPLLLQKSASDLREAVNEVREEALANALTQIASGFTTIQQASPLAPIAATPPPSQPASTVTTSTPDSTLIASLLEQKRLRDNYDVYICYDDADEKDVMEIAECIKAQGFLPWLDVLAPVGGIERQQQEEQIEKIPVAVVAVRQPKMLDKQALQAYTFIDQFVQRRLPVIPVILRNPPQNVKLSPYLNAFKAVDFRRSLPDPMVSLITGIRRSVERAAKPEK